MLEKTMTKRQNRIEGKDDVIEEEEDEDSKWVDKKVNLSPLKKAS